MAYSETSSLRKIGSKLDKPAQTTLFHTHTQPIDDDDDDDGDDEEEEEEVENEDDDMSEWWSITRIMNHGSFMHGNPTHLPKADPFSTSGLGVNLNYQEQR